MDYIRKLHELNISFKLIDESTAVDFLRSKHSFYKLLDIASVFEKYINGEKRGKYVSLDFSQLFYLAEIDVHLGQLLMCLCLEIEERLRARLIFDAESVCNTETFFAQYYEENRLYLDSIYVPENIDIMKDIYMCEIGQMNFNQFVSASQFGALERLLHSFYKQYSIQLYGNKIAPFELRLGCVKRLRNIVAHNHTIIGRLPFQNEKLDVKMLSFLGQNGIKHKTLKTNMSRTVISDLCGLISIYFLLCDEIEEFISCLRSFDLKFCKKYGYLFNDVYMLRTSYNFVKSVIEIFLKNQKKVLT